MSCVKSILSCRWPYDLVPQTIGWLMLGVALAAHEHWLALADRAGASELRRALAEAFDAMAAGVRNLTDKAAGPVRPNREPR